MKNPNNKQGATPEELKKYALYRAKRQAEAVKAICEEEDAEKREEYKDYREPLAIDCEQVLDICLSTGGDADGYKITLKDGEAVSGLYYWADWGVYEEVPLREKELDEVIDLYLHGDPSAFIG